MTFEGSTYPWNFKQYKHNERVMLKIKLFPFLMVSKKILLCNFFYNNFTLEKTLERLESLSKLIPLLLKSKSQRVILETSKIITVAVSM